MQIIAPQLRAIRDDYVKDSIQINPHIWSF
jgi:hypothetical protein